MAWQFVERNRRSFQALFFSMQYHFNRAKEYYNIISALDHEDAEILDPHPWMEEKAESRACLISGMAALEAFANTIKIDFAAREVVDLPEEMLSRRLKNKQFKWWPLADKIYFLPYLCNENLSSPTSYFDVTSINFRLLQEIVQIRNRIMHGYPEPELMLLEFRPDRRHLLFDDFESNFTDLSGIPKDFYIFNYECAKICYDNIIWARSSLKEFIEKVDDEYLKVDIIKLKSRVFTDDEITRDHLLKNWRQYITL